MPDRAAVFVGPGLLDKDLDEIDTGAIDIHPPIRRGDFIAAMEAGYQIIGIVDGEFYHQLAVSPKEILIGLRDGRQVVGGSSMGALRAAEMDVYGMQGVGEIYAWYRRGVVTRDDDVALLFASEDAGSYRAVTVPMVNVLWAVRELKRLDIMDANARRRLTSAARRLHWTGRNWGSICATAGLNDHDRETVKSWSRDPDNDLKRLDARQVIEHVTALVRRCRAPKTEPMEAVIS
jgi:ribosomal protein S12 methylthiotransferase accessory factor